MKKIISWHFTDGWKLRNGEPLAIGKTYRFDGLITICKSGLHASKKLLDALSYAPGETLSLVQCADVKQSQNDKFVCRERTVLHAEDIAETLQWAACDIAEAALLITDFMDDRSWDAIEAKRAFLRGEISFKELAAARDAAWAAAGDAARAAAWAATWAAARDAAWAAAGDAARAATRAAAKDATWDAAWDAAWDEINISLTEFILDHHPQFVKHLISEIPEL